MFQPLAQLPLSHIVYLGGVICAFTTFGVALAGVHVWSNLPVRAGQTR